MAGYKNSRPGPTTPSQTGIRIGPVFNPELPDYPDIIDRVPAGQLPQEQNVNLSVAGEGALIPEAYGRVMVVNPRIFAAGTYSGHLYLGLLWCRGEVDEIEKFWMGDRAVTIQTQSIYHQHYTGIPNPADAPGTDASGVDGYLKVAIAGYADTMQDMCYTRVNVSTVLANWPDASISSFRAIIKGKKIYDPRDLTTAYNTNFALMFRDLAVDRGLTIDETNIGAAADYCDELLPAVTGDKRRWGGLLFDRQDTVDKQLALIAEHAGCFYVREAGTVKLIPDAPGSSIATFDDTTNDNIVEGSLKLTKRSLSRLPNQSIVEYKNQGAWPWRTAYAETTLPTGDLRLTTFRMRGFQSYKVAYRHAVERQNRFNLSDLSVQFEVFDEGLEVEIGDIITVTHNVGITSKLFRVVGVTASRFVGGWIISGEEYDPAIYSDVVVTDPTYPDTDLPDPGIVPTPTGFVVTPQVVESQAGIFQSSFKAEWDAIDYQYDHSFEILLLDTAGVVLDTRITTGLSLSLIHI